MSSQINRNPRDPGMRGAIVALRRAARRARELAVKTGTPCYVMREGHIVDAVTGKEVTIPSRSAV